MTLEIVAAGAARFGIQVTVPAGVHKYRVEKIERVG